MFPYRSDIARKRPIPILQPAGANDIQPHPASAALSKTPRRTRLGLARQFQSPLTSDNILENRKIGDDAILEEVTWTKPKKLVQKVHQLKVKKKQIWGMRLEYLPLPYIALYFAFVLVNDILDGKPPSGKMPAWVDWLLIGGTAIFFIFALTRLLAVIFGRNADDVGNKVIGWIVKIPLILIGVGFAIWGAISIFAGTPPWAVVIIVLLIILIARR